MLVLEGIERRYGATLALRIDHWEARAGERWLIAGPSGSGKSTALALLTGLLRPTSGTIVVSGQDLAGLDGSALDRWRGRTIGFVPQRLHLVASLSVLDNVLLAQYLAGNPTDVHRARATLTSVGLLEFLDRRIDVSPPVFLFERVDSVDGREPDRRGEVFRGEAGQLKWKLARHRRVAH